MRCRECECDDDHACVDEVTGEPCHWVEPGLCSSCAVPFPNLTFERAGFVLP